MEDKQQEFKEEETITTDPVLPTRIQAPDDATSGLPNTDIPFDLDATEAAAEQIELRTEASQPFIGQWNQLVSHTNWEKGKIILEWRESLMEQGAPATSYSDEAWSRLVGGVTSQHVGRLRRVSSRFGESFTDYPALYWSHFQAALEWNDAEMWLEGAVQNKWSISQMRNQRWETQGGDPALRPQDSEVIADVDEDFEPLSSQLAEEREGGSSQNESNSDIAGGPRHEGPDFGEEPERAADGAMHSADEFGGLEQTALPAAEAVQPFANLGELPEDVADAFDSFKMAIIRHRASNWSEIKLDDMLGCLEALMELARIPAQSDD